MYRGRTVLLHDSGVHYPSRRGFLKSAGIAACALQAHGALAPTEEVGFPRPAMVRTALGVLRGESSNGVRVFRGVPFAEAPVGPLRFRPAAPLKAWSGVREALEFGPAPMQHGERHVNQSEDCLFLNIWAPEGAGPFPVYVWIHGGGYTSGYAFDPELDGTELAQGGIVAITVAYRLGVFGFLDVSPLLGSSYAGSANNAVTDVIAGLAWVQKNIAAFGGDPDRVTVGGESAGAKLTGILMGTPSAKDLFHQMISESGGAERIWPVKQAQAIAVGFGETWRRGTKKGLSRIATAPARELIGVQYVFMETWPQHFPLRTEIEPALIPQLPVEAIAAGTTKGKRLLIGSNRDESALFVGPHPGTVAAGDLGNLPLAEFLKVYSKYAAVYPDMTVDARRIRALTAEEYWIPTMRVVDAHVKGGGTAWMYRLDFAESSGKLHGYAYHSLDVGMVWDHPHKLAANAGEEESLAAQMQRAWAAFIKGKPPEAPGLPHWPEYQLDTRATMILNATSRVEDRPQEAELRLWDGVL